MVKMPNVNPAGNTKKVDIIGCQTKPEQFKIFKDEHGSIYLLTIASVICKLLGAYYTTFVLFECTLYCR